MNSDLMPNFTPLCFDRVDFNRKDFNVETFLLKARRRGNTFEEIRDDLRVFLKIIQNSMIELINKDYADFVHLSANLAGLRSAVEKLNLGVGDLVKDFDDISTKIQQSVDVLSTKFDEKVRLTEEQQTIQTKMTAFNKLEQLKALLNRCHNVAKKFEFLERLNFLIVDLKTLYVTRSDDLGIDFDKKLNNCLDKYQHFLETLFVSEINSRKTETSQKNKIQQSIAIILNSFDACGRVDSAHAIFLSEFVENDIRNVLTSKKYIEKTSQLNQILNVLNELRQEYTSIFEPYTYSQVPSFLLDCLLTALLSCLDENFGSVLFPTDPNVFRKAYNTLIKFFSNWSDGSQQKSSGLIRMIFNKFNVSVYYQLRKQEILAILDKAFIDKHRPINEKAGDFSLQCCSTLFNCVDLIWSDGENGIYLPPLTSKCFELTFLLLNRFDHFLSEISREFVGVGNRTAHDISSSINGDNLDNKSIKQHNASTLPDFGIVVNAVGDVIALEKAIRLFFQNVIAPKLNIGDSSISNIADVDRMHIFDRCLTDTFHKLQIRADHLIYETLSDLLIQKVSSHLSAVGEIPRQYRWTRKEAPSQSSAYVSNGFQPIYDFIEVTKNRLPNECVTKLLTNVFEKVVQSYASDIKSVVESVDKISSSLNKLKKSGKGMSSSVGDATAVGGATDDEKIRMQLNLDVKEFSKLVADLKLPKEICDMNILDELVNAKNYNIEQ